MKKAIALGAILVLLAVLWVSPAGTQIARHGDGEILGGLLARHGEGEVLGGPMARHGEGEILGGA